jgi:hypothetical protein
VAAFARMADANPKLETFRARQALCRAANRKLREATETSQPDEEACRKLRIEARQAHFALDMLVGEVPERDPFESEATARRGVDRTTNAYVAARAAVAAKLAEVGRHDYFVWEVEYDALALEEQAWGEWVAATGRALAFGYNPMNASFR